MRARVPILIIFPALLASAILPIACDDPGQPDPSPDQNPNLLRAGRCIGKGEYALIANANVIVDISEETQIPAVTLEVTNDTAKDVYVPVSFESKNYSIVTKIRGRHVHMDGGMVRFPEGYTVLAPGKTTSYNFTLDEPLNKKAECRFSVWAPIRDDNNWRKIIKRDDVVYEVVGYFQKRPEPPPPSDPDTWESNSEVKKTVVLERPDKADPTVAKLLLPSERDNAFKRILSWQNYRSAQSYREDKFSPLCYVVECPQKTGPSIYAVYPWSSSERRPLPKGHVILIDADGAMIPHYCNANFLAEESEFKDINGDGVIDEIGAIPTEKAYIYYVLPVTCEQQPSLRILLRKNDSKPELNWRLAKTDNPNVFYIELGPGDPDSEQFEPQLIFRWSEEKQDYIGPHGGNDQSFKRLKPSATWPLEEMEAFVGGKNRVPSKE